jgi:hypothetical protein
MIRAIGIALALALAGSTAATAQAADTDTFVAPNTPEWAQCRDTLDADNLSSFMVAQEVLMQDTTPAMLAQVSLIAQRIAATVRAALGAPDESVPPGNALGMFEEGSQDVPIDIVLHRDGPTTWRSATPSAHATTPKVTAFYMQVLKSIPPDSLWIVWPDGYSPDSLVLRLNLESYRKNMLLSERKIASFMVFMAHGVTEGPAIIRDKGPMVYPSDANFQSRAGRVVLQYVVDTSGRADSTTIRVLEPSDSEIDTTATGRFYREFIDASRNAVLQTQYLPAHVGGCPMRQRAHAEFTYPERRP